MPITISPSNPLWPTHFTQIRSSLLTLLTSTPHLSIEHVGSTSVPDLPAKPIIDIDIVVTETQLGPVIAALQPGYLYMGELGIPGRHAFRAPEMLPERNLYVCVQGCAALRNHLAVREVLRRDGAVRREYGALKVELGSRGLEIHEYMALKNEMMVRILRLSGGLSEEELEELERAKAAARRVRPIKTERFVLREFVVTDVDGLVRAGLTASVREAQELAREIIQNAGKKQREHVELAVLSHDEEEQARLVGRIGLRLLNPRIETADTALTKVVQASTRREADFLLLYAFFDPDLGGQGYVQEAMDAFLPALDVFIPAIAKKLDNETEPRPRHDAKIVEAEQGSLAKYKRTRIDSSAIQGCEVYEVERSGLIA